MFRFADQPVVDENTAAVMRTDGKRIQAVARDFYQAVKDQSEMLLAGRVGGGRDRGRGAFRNGLERGKRRQLGPIALIRAVRQPRRLAFGCRRRLRHERHERANQVDHFPFPLDPHGQLLLCLTVEQSEMKIDPVMYADVVGRELPAQKLVAEALGFNVRFQDWIYRDDLDFTWRGNVRIALQGANGSGKSTTFKMLTGEISMTDGNAYINNYSVIKQLDNVRKNIG